ncbi:response regulator transcription factor [Paractinoplanes aksuensis]|uniref:response regulator transcription factor n=1 Tax=Paractinoplanes aksuensis TaxID=2939490 RepID=UPI0027E37CF4|nr:response regulator transcription factor [Actinoplanes aksuensis]
MRAAAGGGTVLSPVAAQRLLGAAGDRRRVRERLSRLSERETEVLAGLGAGDSNLRIARRLRLSEATVKGYVSRLLVKLDCDNRTQAGLLAQQGGLGPESVSGSGGDQR